MGKGELATGGDRRRSNIVDATEAIIGAIFLDRGFYEVENFILNLWSPYLKEEKFVEESFDYKSQLQERLMKKQVRPEYRILSSFGPDHEKEYLVGLYIQGKEVSSAKAFSKKKGEQIAAEKYLKSINS